jgi:hypothetical protein
VSRLSDSAARRRRAAVSRLRIVVPALFALGFLFYSAITIFPLAGMPGPPLDPRGGTGPLLLWLAVASACGGLFALFGALVVAVSASSEDETEWSSASAADGGRQGRAEDGSGQGTAGI